MGGSESFRSRLEGKMQSAETVPNDFIHPLRWSIICQEISTRPVVRAASCSTSKFHSKIPFNAMERIILCKQVFTIGALMVCVAFVSGKHEKQFRELYYMELCE